MARAVMGAAALGIIGAYLTQQITVEQINARTRQAGEFWHRGEVREIDPEDRTIELAISSETAVLRWFGDDVADQLGGAFRQLALLGSLL